MSYILLALGCLLIGGNLGSAAERDNQTAQIILISVMSISVGVIIALAIIGFMTTLQN